jgi:hypothetical protein
MQQATARGRLLDVGLGWFHRHSDPPSTARYWEHLGRGGLLQHDPRLPELKRGLAAMGNVTDWDHLRLVHTATQQA